MYGTNYTDLHNAVNDFYTNGGHTCAVVRIAGSGALAAGVKVYDDTVTARRTPATRRCSRSRPRTPVRGANYRRSS
jgi:hypothetical protein